MCASEVWRKKYHAGVQKVADHLDLAADSDPEDPDSEWVLYVLLILFSRAVLTRARSKLRKAGIYAGT